MVRDSRAFKMLQEHSKCYGSIQNATGALKCYWSIQMLLEHSNATGASKCYWSIQMLPEHFFEFLFLWPSTNHPVFPVCWMTGVTDQFSVWYMDLLQVYVKVFQINTFIFSSFVREGGVNIDVMLTPLLILYWRLSFQGQFNSNVCLFGLVYWEKCSGSILTMLRAGLFPNVHWSPRMDLQKSLFTVTG